MLSFHSRSGFAVVKVLLGVLFAAALAFVVVMLVSGATHNEVVSQASVQAARATAGAQAENALAFARMADSASDAELAAAGVDPDSRVPGNGRVELGEWQYGLMRALMEADMQFDAGAYTPQSGRYLLAHRSGATALIVPGLDADGHITGFSIE